MALKDKEKIWSKVLVWVVVLQSMKRVRFFRTPKDDMLLKQWAKKLPKKPDKSLNASSRVCENYFLEQDIIKNDEIIIGGKVVLVARPIWTLKPGAIPSIF